MRRLASLLVLAAVIGLTLAADPPKSADTDPLRKSAAFEQERLRQQFNAFEDALKRLKDRLEKSTKPEDRERATVLQQALDRVKEKQGDDKRRPEERFAILVNTLTTQGVTLRDIEAAIGQNEQLLKTLREILALLLSDSNALKAKEEQKRLQELLKMLDSIIRAQKVERSKVESGKGDPKELAKGQAKVTDQTEKLSKHLDKGKAGAPKDGKPKDGAPKDGKPKAGDPKEGKPKEGQPKDGQPKAGDPKDGKPKDGQPKDGQPKDGKPKDGQPKNGQPKNGQPKDGQPKESDPNQDPNQPENPDELPGRQQVEDAIENQKKAEDQIKKDERKKASAEQDEAIKKLEEMRKEIEKRLKQLREEELERLLANLEARLSLMLQMQQEVYDGTKRVAGEIASHDDKKPTRNDDLKAGELSAKEGQIVGEANKALQLLQEEGSAVAFPLVLEDIREQMKVVQSRLFKTDAGPFTQSIEEDIIASLKEMKEAVKKAQRDMKDRQNQPPPPPGGKPPDQKLIDLLAELRMIRSLQIQINNRTKAYADQYPGEQANDPDIRKELQGLGTRESKVHKVTKDIATGKNVGQ